MESKSEELKAKVRELNLKFKEAVKQRSGNGSLSALGRIFRRMDKDGNQKLDATEFEKALAAFGFNPEKADLQALINYYDHEGDGGVSYDEFLRGLRDEMAPNRLKMI